MDSFDAYQMVRSLRLHFTTEKYDYHKYNGKTKVTVDQRNRFLQGNQKFFYGQIARHTDPEKLVVANFLKNPKVFVAGITSDEGQDLYKSWLARQSKLTYMLTEQLSEGELYKSVTKVENGLPVLISKYISGQIAPEVIIMVDGIIHQLDKWSQLDHPLMSSVDLRLRKYKPFVKYDKFRVKSAINELFTGRPLLRTSAK